MMMVFCWTRETNGNGDDVFGGLSKKWEMVMIFVTTLSRKPTYLGVSNRSIDTFV